MTKTIVNIYTDGACSGNPGPGGFGVIIEIPDLGFNIEFSEGYKLTTNNRMELLSVIKALKYFLIENNYKIDYDFSIKIYSDSKYVTDAVNKKWIYSWIKRDFKNVKNIDLWKEFLKIFNTNKDSIEFIWIKGHNNNKFNEKCDTLAVKAYKNGNLLTDENYEKLTK